MQWLRRNAVGLLGLVLAIAALVSGAEAYWAGVRRDEQARAIPRRLERGEVELAEQHRKTVAALSGLADVTRTVAYNFAGLAVVAGILQAGRSRPNLWLIGATAVLAAGAVALAFESRADPAVAADGEQ